MSGNIQALNSELTSLWERPNYQPTKTALALKDLIDTIETNDPINNRVTSKSKHYKEAIALIQYNEIENSFSRTPSDVELIRLFTKTTIYQASEDANNREIVRNRLRALITQEKLPKSLTRVVELMVHCFKEEPTINNPTLINAADAIGYKISLAQISKTVATLKTLKIIEVDKYGTYIFPTSLVDAGLNPQANQQQELFDAKISGALMKIHQVDRLKFSQLAEFKMANALPHRTRRKTRIAPRLYASDRRNSYVVESTAGSDEGIYRMRDLVVMSVIDAEFARDVIDKAKKNGWTIKDDDAQSSRRTKTKLDWSNKELQSYALEKRTYSITGVRRLVKTTKNTDIRKDDFIKGLIRVFFTTTKFRPASEEEIRGIDPLTGITSTDAVVAIDQYGDRAINPEKDIFQMSYTLSLAKAACEGYYEDISLLNFNEEILILTLVARKVLGYKTAFTKIKNIQYLAHDLTNFLASTETVSDLISSIKKSDNFKTLDDGRLQAKTQAFIFTVDTNKQRVADFYAEHNYRLDQLRTKLALNDAIISFEYNIENEKQRSTMIRAAKSLLPKYTHQYLYLDAWPDQVDIKTRSETINYLITHNEFNTNLHIDRFLQTAIDEITDFISMHEHHIDDLSYEKCLKIMELRNWFGVRQHWLSGHFDVFPPSQTDFLDIDSTIQGTGIEDLDVNHPLEENTN
ncbi:hypothetical protein [uncultured Umboniibacter sp.]|uniref:hypothetical protein n=1 Tax=uncultured Umboniibacter sp. TaxID=1798917 RepID=UPI002628E781|nr:hypothetical protein [uncultured Umboniibacter sp.]